MSTNDPDDQPTRFGGGKQPSGPDPSDDRTRPSLGKDAAGGAGGAAASKPNVGKPNDGRPNTGKPTPGKSDAATPAPKPKPAEPSVAPATAGPVDPMFGKVLGGCRLDKLLGRGAMGAVYKARQLKLDRDVAVKVIRPEMMADQRMLKRFEVEARTVGKFNSQHVVMVHDVGFEQGVHWLVMELVEGKNLRDHVKLLAGGRLPVGEALPLLRQAIKGLEEAQRLAVVHRDIKPDNLMLTDRGVLKIADFGIAKPLQEDFSMTMTSELVGTPLYMSPEQCQGEGALDFRSDMYSLGATFYYLLTGEPPIRASSVYELIQTKTKLANLCLWKALPGLGENNPLSRVVERMTSLDREDRYDSYEALLADLVLVEQGATITVPKAGSARARRVEAASRASSSRTIALGVAAALALAAGGYWWSRPTPTPNPGPGVVVDSETASRLQAARTRFAEQGPSADLLTTLRALPASGERDALLADVDGAQRLQEALQALATPSALELPFDDLRAHFDKVAAAAVVPATAGAELRAFAAKAGEAARAENTLADRAVRKLSSAFVEWKGQRDKAGNDTEALAALGSQLERITAARQALVDLLPKQRPDLERDVPVAALDAARLGLKGGSAVAETDNGAALQAIAAGFAKDGPAASLQSRLRDLQPTRPEQLKQRQTLLDEFQRAETARTQAQDARTNKFPAGRAPFDDIADYYATLERAFDPVRGADRSLPPWAAKLRGELREEATLQTRVVGACAAALGEARTETELAAVETALQRGKQVLPSSAAELDKLDLAGARARLGAAAKASQWDAAAAQLGKRLTELPSLGEFVAQRATFTAELETLARSANELGGERALVVQRLQAQSERWGQAVTQLAAIAAKAAAGDLAAADQAVLAGVPGSEGRAELTRAGEVITACREAFAGIEKVLDLDAARRALATARTKAQSLGPVLPGVEARVKEWQDGVEALATAAAGMVPIAGGRTRAQAAVVPAFFLSSTECSRAEFAQFLTEVKNAVAGITDPAQRLAKIEARFPGVGLTTERLQSLLDWDVSRDLDKTPIDNLTWHAAAAFAAWYGRTLPTLGEWSLAAFGDGNKYEFPWGNGWTTDPQLRNPSNQQLADGDAGGLSWRQADGVRLHHLAGNVAEWLQADAKDATAGVAGGRYNDNSETSVREQAGGKELKTDKTDARRGFGFRTALRPRSFPGLDWPRN